MDGKENRRITLTKRLIQEGLLRLLEQKDLAKVSVTELCREADVNRATFYKYYGSPEDVLAAIKDQFFDGFYEYQQRVPEKGADTYVEAFGQVCGYVYENKTIARHILQNMNFDISEILIESGREPNGILKFLQKYFQGDDLRLATTCVGYGCYSIVREWLVEDLDKTPEEIAGIFQKLLNISLF